MKKIIKSLVLIVFLFISCACVKDETVMTINKDKSLNLTVNIGYPLNSSKKLSFDEVKDKVENQNYSIDSYHDSKYQGFSISKKYDNINDLSVTDNFSINLADIINGDFDDSKLFTIKKGFFKNTYTANYTYNFKDIYSFKKKIYLFGEDTNLESIDINNYITELIKDNNNYELVKNNTLSNLDNFNKLKEVLVAKGMEFSKIPTIIIGDNIFVGNSDETKSKIKEYVNDYNQEYTDIVNPNDIDSDYELTFKLNIPFNVINNNATSKEGNTFVWNTNYFDDNKINFSFTIFKPSSIVIIILLTSVDQEHPCVSHTVQAFLIDTVNTFTEGIYLHKRIAGIHSARFISFPQKLHIGVADGVFRFSDFGFVLFPSDQRIHVPLKRKRCACHGTISFNLFQSRTKRGAVFSDCVPFGFQFFDFFRIFLDQSLQFHNAFMKRETDVFAVTQINRLPDPHDYHHDKAKYPCIF